MDWESHRMFGRLIANQYDEPVDGYLEWTIMPDMQYFKLSAWRHTFLHRTSLHGADNIDAVIAHGKRFPQYVRYSPSRAKYIRCLIMSHSYLDLFNFIIHPSWPHNRHFRFLWRQIPRIFKLGTLFAPPGLRDVLAQMVRQHRNAWDLYHTMLMEYLGAPEEGLYVQKILKLYEG